MHRIGLLSLGFDGRHSPSTPAGAPLSGTPGARQSTPSISIASCSELGASVSPGSTCGGRRNTPRSSRLVNRRRLAPSQNTILIRLAVRPRNTKRWPENGSCRSTRWTQHGEPVDSLAHIGVTERQGYLQSSRKQLHGTHSTSAGATPDGVPASVICTARNTGGVNSCFHRHRTRRAMPYRRAILARLALQGSRLAPPPLRESGVCPIR